MSGLFARAQFRHCKTQRDSLRRELRRRDEPSSARAGGGRSSLPSASSCRTLRRVKRARIHSLTVFWSSFGGYFFCTLCICERVRLFINDLPAASNRFFLLVGLFARASRCAAACAFWRVRALVVAVDCRLEHSSNREFSRRLLADDDQGGSEQI